ncbi:MAG: peptide chain release factor N(5)-glutamine methyltransferase [Planctomycetota bacterium]
MTEGQTTTPETWTTRKLLAWMSRSFEQKDLEAPRVLAEMLMTKVLGCERIRLYADADRPATEDERTRLRDLVARALRHEPVQYLVGEAWFFAMPFHVDPRVFIPRPCTTLIVEHVLQAARLTDGDIRFADICTGSGAIAVAIAHNFPAAHGIAIDRSTDALDVARANAETHGVQDRIDFHVGDLLRPLAETPPLDFLVSNPPYIPDFEWDDVPPNVKDHEPVTALRAGADGLVFVRPLIESGPAHLRSGGHLLIEIAASTADAVLDLAAGNGDLVEPEILQDFEGLPRVLSARRA